MLPQPCSEQKPPSERCCVLQVDTYACWCCVFVLLFYTPCFWLMIFITVL